MRELAAEVGGAPTQTEMNERGEFSQRLYYREWDSWGKALAAAGVERNSERVHGIDDEQLLDALRELSRAVGRPPTAEMMNDRGQFSVYPYLRRWGTWNDALRAAGFGINKAGAVWRASSTTDRTGRTGVGKRSNGTIGRACSVTTPTMPTSSDTGRGWTFTTGGSFGRLSRRGRRTGWRI
jgi:hypothetical protein